MGSTVHQGLDDVIVAELDGTHQRGVVVPVSHVDAGAVLK